MFSKKTEITVGVFMIAGIIALIYLSVSLGNIEVFNSNSYSVSALFDSITGLRKGATVEVAGVQVGKVTGIRLDEGMAMVDLSINDGFRISDDSIASIRTKGIIGEKYIKLTPGGSDIYLEDGESLFETESAISIEELISKYIYEMK